MKERICKFKQKTCQKFVETPEGGQSTWSMINQLSNLGDKEFGPGIDTREIPQDYIFKQTFPRRVAEIYSTQQIFLGIHVHSCKKCSFGIQGVLSLLAEE